MSRQLRKPAYDKGQWVSDKAMPDYLVRYLEGVEAARGDGAECEVKLDKESCDLLISRARYISDFNRETHEFRLEQLARADEILASENADGAARLINERYPSDRLHPDEDIKNPSDDARTRASLLYAHFARLKDKALVEGRRAWPPYYDDLLIILKVWSVPGDEKRALAQRLVLENPRISRSKIAQKSAEYEGCKFDQSCLSQWIISGMVIDPYPHLRPKKF